MTINSRRFARKSGVFFNTEPAADAETEEGGEEPVEEGTPDIASVLLNAGYTTVHDFSNAGGHIFASK